MCIRANEIVRISQGVTSRPVLLKIVKNSLSVSDILGVISYEKAEEE